MGNVDRVLEALVRRLPKTAGKVQIVAALRASASALPEKQEKTRRLLKAREEKLVATLQEKLREKKEVKESREKPAAVVEEPAPSSDVETAPGVDRAQASDALYAGIPHGDQGACLARCADLLGRAMTSQRSAQRAEDAVDGLLAILPSNSGSNSDSDMLGGALKASSLERFVRLVPLAAAALENRESPAWRRLLAFVLSAPCLVGSKAEQNGKGLGLSGCASGMACTSKPGTALFEDENSPGTFHCGVCWANGGKIDLSELATRLGSLFALFVRPAVARAALQMTLANGLGKERGPGKLALLVPTILPAIIVAFGSSIEVADSSAPPPSRGEFFALCLAFRLVGLWRSSHLVDDQRLSEASSALRGALGRRFANTFGTLGSELKPFVAKIDGSRGKALGRRLASSLGPSCASSHGGAAAVGAADCVAEVLEMAAPSVSLTDLSRLADALGLPKGDDEIVDSKAAAAKARGELFFEDIEGGLDPGDGGDENVEVEKIEGLDKLRTGTGKRKRGKGKHA